MKKIIFALTYIILVAIYSFAQNNFSDKIMLDEIERRYPPIEVYEPNYSISLYFDQNHYRLGNPLVMEVRISALKGKLSFTNSPNHFENYQFSLYDSNNNKIGVSEAYTLWKHRDLATAGGNSDSVVTLNEGESFSYKLDLNNWFIINNPGLYRIEGAFYPIPKLSRQNLKTSTSYFQVSKPVRGMSEASVKRNVYENIPYSNPSTKPPYDVVKDALSALQYKDWKAYFENMYLPSIIMISDRYGKRFVELYGENVENFSDTGMQRKIDRMNISKFLEIEFGTTVTMESLGKIYGNNFIRDFERTYKANTVRDLSIMFELRYRNTLPADRRVLFDEYKKYMASMYDRNLRKIFMHDIDKKSITEKDPKKKEYYKELYKIMKKEYADDTVFELTKFEIVKTVVETKYEMPTAVVEAKLSQRFINLITNDVYAPVVIRTFTLRKMGDYWYIVDYYDKITG